jgi:hypothetical protein
MNGMKSFFRNMLATEMGKSTNVTSPQRAKKVDWKRFETPDRVTKTPKTTNMEVKEREARRVPDQTEVVVVPSAESRKAVKRHSYQYRFRNDHTEADSKKDFTVAPAHIHTKDVVKTDTVLPRHKVDANIGSHFNNEQSRDYEAIARDISAMKQATAVNGDRERQGQA